MLLSFFCHPANLPCEIESHSPEFPRVRTWPLRNKGKEGGLWTWNDSPTLKCKTLLPQHGTGLLPLLICRKWLEPETMSLTPSSQPLKLAQHAVSGQSRRGSACWIEGSACGKQDSVCFYYSRQLLSSEELIPPPSSCPKVWPLAIDTHFNVILKAATFNFRKYAGSILGLFKTKMSTSK